MLRFTSCRARCSSVSRRSMSSRMPFSHSSGSGWKYASRRPAAWKRSFTTDGRLDSVTLKFAMSMASTRQVSESP